jgi:hypothetical protein
MDTVLTYLKSINYISIDYSLKIKNKKDYVDMILKIMNEKYNKCVIVLNLKNMPEDICKFIKKNTNCEVKNNNIYYLLNKDNYLFRLHTDVFYQNIIDNFLGIKLNELYTCNICLKDTFISINQCRRCNATTCSDCVITTIIHKDNTSGIKNVNCVVCNYLNGTLTI